MAQLALLIDLNVCVGCSACVTSCKEWNTSGQAGPMVDFNAYDKNPTGTFLTVFKPLKWVNSYSPKLYISLNHAFIVKIRHAYPFAQQGQVTSAKKMALFWWIMTNALVVSIALGHVHTVHVN